MSSDNPCVKPDFAPLPDDPLFDDCTIAPAPPPITDCSDIELPVPASASDSSTPESPTIVLPIVVVSCADCILTVQRIILATDGSYTPVGPTFDAIASGVGCTCDNIWPEMLGIASKHESGDGWLATINGISPLIYFKLSEDMASNEADADIYVASSGSYTDSGRNTTIHDPDNHFPTAKSGAAGVAFCRPTNDGSYRWEVVQLQQKAYFIQITLSEDLEPDDSSVTAVVSVVYGIGHWKPVVSDEIEVLTTLDWTADSGAKGLALLTASGEYVLIQVDCPS